MWGGTATCRVPAADFTVPTTALAANPRHRTGDRYHATVQVGVAPPSAEVRHITDATKA
jgi:hypothetical protein